MSKYTQLLMRADNLKRELDGTAPKMIHVKHNADGSIILPRATYVSYPSLRELLDDDAQIKIIMGPYGSGKSSGITVGIVELACRMPKCVDGIRRLRCLAIRNTYDELKSTTLQMWNEWTGGLGKISTNRQPPITWSHKFNDENGRVHLEIIFLALNNEQALKKLDSYNFTIAYLNEVRGLPQGVLRTISSRTGRYPPQRLLAKEDRNFWHGVLGDTNPPNSKHWLKKLEDRGDITYKDAEGKERTMRAHIIHQPEAIHKNDAGIYVPNPFAENIENLPGGYDYYFNMLQHGDDYVAVYAQGKYGSLRSGQVVYSNYNDDIHSVSNLAVDKTQPILLGVDYGRTCPAILAAQYINKQLRVIKEFVGSHIFIYDMAREDVLPWLAENCGKHLVNNRMVFNLVGRDDCAQTDDGRTQLRNLGLEMQSARTNKPEPRIQAVGHLLGKMTGSGQPAIVIDREGCPMLREGFQGEYKLEEYKNALNGDTKDTPVKSHPYSDVHDALQYIALDYANIASLAQDNVSFESPKPQNMWM